MEHTMSTLIVAVKTCPGFHVVPGSKGKGVVLDIDAEETPKTRRSTSQTAILQRQLMIAAFQTNGGRGRGRRGTDGDLDLAAELAGLSGSGYTQTAVGKRGDDEW